MKTLLEIEPAQVNLLSTLCKRDGISRAEAIRRAIDYYAERMLAPKNADEYFGYFSDRKVNSLAYVDELRDAW